MNDEPKRNDLESADFHQVLTVGTDSPFSQRAFLALRQQVEGFIVDLIDESAKIARRHRSDTVSVSDVEQAATYLVSSARNRIFRHIGTVGGILFGAGLSTILSLITAGTISSSGLMTASGFSIVGAFLVALHVAKDRG